MAGCLVAQGVLRKVEVLSAFDIATEGLKAEGQSAPCRFREVARPHTQVMYLRDEGLEVNILAFVSQVVVIDS